MSTERPRLTEDVPGCGGAFKLVPEDFEVEELPAYELSGEGEHLYLWVEKRGRDTRELVRALSTALGVNEGDVGVAGMKDRQAITRQLLSVPARAEARVADFALDGRRARELHPAERRGRAQLLRRPALRA
jgi:tRNA pseudouridine13 synthase